MSIEDSMYNVPLLSNEFSYPYLFHKNEDEFYDDDDDVEANKNNIEPLEIEYEVNNFYGYPFGSNVASENNFKDKMLCLFTVFSFCFPFNLIFLFIYKYT